MSKYKGQTEGIQPSSSGESTEEAAQPFLPSASTDNTPNSTEITSLQSQNMLSVEQVELTTVATTPTTVVTTVAKTEKTRQHALVMKVALLFLLKTGLVKRYTVLTKEKTVKEIQVVFSPDVWTENFDLK